jgi:hypothetical protein
MHLPTSCRSSAGFEGTLEEFEWLLSVKLDLSWSILVADHAASGGFGLRSNLVLKRQKSPK